MTAIPTYNDGSNSKKTVYKALEAGLYPARLVRFTGLGIQPQPEFKGEKKRPAFKVATQWQLFSAEDPSQPLYAIELGKDEKDENKIVETLTDRPSCQFADFYLFPGAERGKVFDMCKAFDASISKTPSTLDWYFEKLGTAAMVQIRKYERKDGTFGNAIGSITPILPMLAKMMPPASVELVGFNPYVNDDTNAVAYARMFRFQHQILSEALDKQHIPLAGSEPIKLDAVNNTDSSSSTTENGGADTSVTENPFQEVDDEEAPF